MKILVIGSARTGSTAFTEYVKLQNEPTRNLHEYFSIRYKKPFTVYSNLIKDYTKVQLKIDKLIFNETNKLFEKVPNFIIKVLGCHLGGYFPYMESTQPQSYDKIYTIERHDFFNQVCSNYIANQENIWHKRSDRPDILEKHQIVKNKQYTIYAGQIINVAYDILQYLRCKRYLENHNIEYEQKYFDDDLFNVENIGCFSRNEFDYKSMVKNYYLHDDVMEIFNKHFDYSTLYHDFESFKIDIGKLPID